MKYRVISRMIIAGSAGHLDFADVGGEMGRQDPATQAAR